MAALNAELNQDSALNEAGRGAGGTRLSELKLRQSVAVPRRGQRAESLARVLSILSLLLVALSQVGSAAESDPRMVAPPAVPAPAHGLLRGLPAVDGHRGRRGGASARARRGVAGLVSGLAGGQLLTVRSNATSAPSILPT